MSEPLLIQSAADVPASFGRLRRAQRKTTVRIREPQPPAGQTVEVCETSWGSLQADVGIDWVIVPDSGAPYPIKREIFAQTYQEVEPGRYRKSAISQLVQVPAGVTALLKTLEGDEQVAHPDYIAVGSQGEVYANGAEWVAQNLVWVDLDA